MKWKELEEEPCSMARTIGAIGDRWTLLILRECFLRTRRFEGFQSALGITRHLLAERLKKLVRQGILRRIPYQESPKRHEYILTQKGLDLYPIMMAIVHWGDTHMVDERGRPLLLLVGSWVLVGCTWSPGAKDAARVETQEQTARNAEPAAASGQPHARRTYGADDAAIQRAV